MVLTVYNLISCNRFLIDDGLEPENFANGKEISTEHSIWNGRSEQNGLLLEAVYNFQTEFPEKNLFHLTFNQNVHVFPGQMVSTTNSSYLFLYHV